MVYGQEFGHNTPAIMLWEHGDFLIHQNLVLRIFCATLFCAYCVMQMSTYSCNSPRKPRDTDNCGIFRKPTNAGKNYANTKITAILWEAK